MQADPRYRGLLIGNASFPRDPHALLTLRGPRVDIEQLEQALTDDKIGLFPSGSIRMLPDSRVQDLREDLDKFFTTAAREDVLLLYYSGHGRLDEHGELYLCATDTVLDRLRATALSAAEINNMIRGSAAATVVIVLDCCHSGAFKTGIDLAAPVSGRGRYVLASNRSTQLARDAEAEGQPSPFTGRLIHGLRHAETRGHRHLTVAELYRHVHEWMTEGAPTPPQLSFAGEGDVVIARRRKNRPQIHTRHVQKRVPADEGVAVRPAVRRVSKANEQPSAERTGTVPNAAVFFEESWTGKEDIESFTDYDVNGVALAFWCVGLVLFVVAAILWWVGDWPPALGTALLGGLSLAPMGLPMLQLRGGMGRRELQLGPDGITTVDTHGRQHIPWEQVTGVSVRATPEKVSGHHLVALHVRCRPAAGTAGAFYWPAGWPALATLPDVCRGPEPPDSSVWVPVCVLGPMREPRRVELKNTVMAHTGQPLEAPWDW
ncbi:MULTISPECIES: caspase family protein [Streptomyces]|uniref:caspase family protein n=1 Tax=Streptomyces TaxID=1883 RepID=UPI0036CA88ED